jgi:hypothetical protein
MREDPIVDEVRKYRDQRAAKFNYNLRAIAEDAKKRERQGGRPIVSPLHPKGRANQSSGKP